MEVPRHWREKGFRYNPSGESCHNCSNVEIQIRRPVCQECGIIFKPEEVTQEGELLIRTHRVIGKKMKIYLIEGQRTEEEPIEIEIPNRIKIREPEKV